MKGAVGVTGAVVAAGYTRPELRALGVSQALAVSPGGEIPPDDPPKDPPTDPPTDPPKDPPTTKSASLELDVSAQADPKKIYGTVCVTNASDDDGSVDISKVTVMVEPRKLIGGFGGKCGEPKTILLTRSSTGGSNSLAAGTTVTGPTGQTTCFSLHIEDPLIQNYFRGDDFRVHVVVEFGPHHVHGTRSTQTCASVDV